MSSLKKIFVLFLVLNGLKAGAQQANGETFQKEYQLHITKTTVPVIIDGDLNESVWAATEITSPFWRKFPNDEGRPKRKTEVKVTYDDKFIYFGFTSYDSGKAYIQSLKRDIGHDGNDGVGIIAEIAIPFKSIRYTADKLLWGLNFVRIDTKTNEYSTWTHVPVNFRSMDLGYTGALIWKERPPQPGTNIVFIPYVTGDLNADQENGVPTKAGINAGFDGKVALSSSLNLDLTVNPDFSQIEVDQQVTNLSRFSIFFPERRTFFLENSDLFSQYGIPPIRPFYSRTIGLDKDGNKIPILLGARLSGNKESGAPGAPTTIHLNPAS